MLVDRDVNLGLSITVQIVYNEHQGARQVLFVINGIHLNRYTSRIVNYSL